MGGGDPSALPHRLGALAGRETPGMARHVERRLTTILCADIAEYSRLMRADEDGTMRGLTAMRAIVDALIAEHRGRIANTAGDSVLAEFPSVVNGLVCAIAIQRAVAKQYEEFPAHRRLRYRIGVHVGDVMTRAGDLFGDAVNVAARLQALAEPGGICVSASVRDHVASRVSATFVDAGPQQVKSLAEPVHVFRVGCREAASPARAPAPALPDKPSVAVLPFANMSADPEQEYFADGIAEDIITALSRYPSLFVIARNSCFTYKGRAIDVKQVGQELGVRYVLEGSLRRAGNRIRVSAQLTEGETGKHVWAERYDRDLADIFAVQDEITEAVTTAIAPAIGHAEQQRAMRKPPDSLDAWGAFQRGVWHMMAFTAADVERAREFFQKAIDLDPNFVGGYYGLAGALIQSANIFMNAEPAEALATAEALARQAIALDGTDAEAHACLGRILLTRGNPEGARRDRPRPGAQSQPRGGACDDGLDPGVYRPAEGRSGDAGALHAARSARVALGRRGQPARHRPLFLPRVRGGGGSGAAGHQRASRPPAGLSLARRGARPARPQRGGAGRARPGDDAFARGIRRLCPPPRRLAPPGRFRAHARRSEKGRLGRLKRRPAALGLSARRIAAAAPGRPGRRRRGSRPDRASAADRSARS